MLILLGCLWFGCSMNLSNHLSHLTSVISAELADFACEAPGIECVEHRLDRGQAGFILQNDQVVTFLSERNKSEPIGVRCHANCYASIGFGRGDRLCYFEMARELARVALDSLGWQPQVF